MSQNINKAIEAIQKCRTEVKTHLHGVPDLSVRTDNVLKTMVANLQHAVSASSSGDAPSNWSGGNKKLTHVAGKKIKRAADNAGGEKPAVKIPDEPTKNEFEARVDKAYEDFPVVDTKLSLEHFGEDIIRGVAVKAGLEVTPTEPKTITQKFINEIKDQIQFLKEQAGAASAAEQHGKDDDNSNGEGSGSNDGADNTDNAGGEKPADDNQEEE